MTTSRNVKRAGSNVSAAERKKRRRQKRSEEKKERKDTETTVLSLVYTVVTLKVRRGIHSRTFSH